MKLPRDLSGAELVKALGRVGYHVTRQSGSHVRLTTDTPSQHHVTIPAHDPLKVGTLAAHLGASSSRRRPGSNTFPSFIRRDGHGVTGVVQFLNLKPAYRALPVDWNSWVIDSRITDLEAKWAARKMK